MSPRQLSADLLSPTKRRKLPIGLPCPNHRPGMGGIHQIDADYEEVIEFAEKNNVKIPINEEICPKMNSSELIIYRSDDGQTRIETRLEDETVWLTIDQMVELFDKSRSTINEHILNIYNEGELERPASMRKIGISDFSSALTKPTNFNKLDVIISVGYRVKSQRGTQFRIWATERLKEYIIKGYTINSEQLENLGGGNYWKDILNSIRATVVWESNRCFR